jgi:hypothetical protein
MNRSLLAAFLLAAAAPAAALVDIGVAAAVRGSVNATAPGAAGRVVETGKAIYQNDKVVTGAESKLQVLLLDESAFTVGPNSEMVLDEFVFDPATADGRVAARVMKGGFRFVSGKIALKDPSRMKVATPVATIGIRGTMVGGEIKPGEATIVLLGPGAGNNADEKGGAITVGNDLGSVDIDKDGWGVTVKDGQAPGKPFELSPSQLEGMMSGVASAPTGDSKDDGSGETAGKESGDDAAGGKALAKDAIAADEAAQDETASFATQQQFGSPSVSTWESVRAITGGTAQYSGSATMYTCPGGGACTTAAGTMSFVLDIDFLGKTVGGGSSAIILGSPANTSGSIGVTSFPLSGEAKLNLQPSISGAGTWSKADLKLLDSGGVTAGAASIDVRWSSSVGIFPTYGGEVTGTR